MRILERYERLSDNKIAFCLLILAFFLRAGYSTIFYLSTETPESNLYYELAQEIIKQGKLFYSPTHPYYEIVGPLLPWINAATIAIFGKSYLGIYLVTTVFSSLVTFFTYKTARLFLNKRISGLIGIWSLLYFFYFYFSPSAGKDILMAFFLILELYFLISLFELNQFSYIRFLIFIFCTVISFHLDERFFLFVPFMFVYILLSESRVFKRLKLTKSLVFLSLMILLMIPWLIRNYKYYDKIILLSTRTQVLTDKLFGYEPVDIASDDFMDLYGKYYIHDNQVDSVTNGLKTETDAGYEISDEQRIAMQKGNLPHPLSNIERYWLNARILIRPFQLVRGEYQKTGYFYYEQSVRQRLVSAIFYGIIFLFSFPGFYYLFHLNRRIFTILLSTVIIYILIHAFFVPWTTWRYRLPLDSIFIIVGCLGIVFLYSKIEHNRTSINIKLL